MKPIIRANGRAEALVTFAVSVIIVGLLYIGVQGIFQGEDELTPGASRTHSFNRQK